MLDAFKIKPFELEPIFATWSDGPRFVGNPKKDLPVDEWLKQIKDGCVQRNIPEEYWYKVAQHFMGPKAKARLAASVYLNRQRHLTLYEGSTRSKPS